MDNQNETPIPSTLDQVRQHRQEIAGGTAAPPAAEPELPTGSAPVQAESTTPPQGATEGNEAPTEASAEAGMEEGEPKQKIRIGTEEFDTKEEAFKYAEKIQQNQLISDARTEGLEAGMAQVPVAPAAEPPPDNFEEEFYADPKQTLTKYKDKARDEALEIFRGEQKAEKLWDKFFGEYPDLDGQRRTCEMVLQDNPLIGELKDVPKAMKLLAAKAREIFQDYNDRTKTRTALPNGPGTISPGGGIGSGGRSGVTPKEEPKKVSTFMEQISSMRKV